MAGNRNGGGRTFLKHIRALSLLGLALLACGPAAAAGDAAAAREAMWAKMLANQSALAISAVFDGQGRLWRVRVHDGHVLVDRSDDLGASFGGAATVNPETEIVGTDGDNRPKIAVAADGTVYVSYTQLLGAPFSGHIRFSRSLDGSRSFTAPVTVNDDRNLISHRFDSLLLDREGRVYIAWLDKRDEHAARQRGESYVGAALYYAVSDDRGASFGSHSAGFDDRSAGPGANTKLADHSCECCRIALALGTDGVPSAFWRHVYEDSERDHALVRLDGKDTPRRITHGHWRVEACPHHGPAFTIDADGTHHFAWFDNGPEARGLFYARSTDGGATRSAPLPLGSPEKRAGHPAVIAHDGTLFLAWKEFDGEVSPVRAMHSHDGGLSWSAPFVLAHTADASDHPQLLAHDGRVFLSWSTRAEGYRLIPLAGARR
jgi:hypothetical protein